MPTVFYTTYDVIGRAFPFPLDMLRHDCAHPRDSGDAQTIHNSITYHGSASEGRSADGFYHVTLVSVSNTKYAYPTEARWSSFGWSVVPESIRRVAA